MKRVVLVTRYPAAGRVKTRLIPALGGEGAAEIHRRLTENTIQTLRGLPVEITVDIYFTGGSEQDMRCWLGNDLHYSRQPAGSLGDRLLRFAAEAFTEKSCRLLFIGADCPTLNRDDVHQAFTLLEDNRVVLGPATDGGYYLIGLGSFEPQLFSDIPWGSDQVLAVTLDRCRRFSLSYALLPSRRDVDRPDDLPFLSALE